MFTVVVSFKRSKEKVIINNLNRVQVNKVCNDWEKNPRTSYVAVMDERF